MGPLRLCGAIALLVSSMPLQAATLVTTDPLEVADFVAGLTPIGFDDLTGSTGGFGSLVPADAVVETDRYASLGVLISSTGGPAYAATRAVDATSDPNLLGPTDRNVTDQLVVDWLEPITLDFVVPGTGAPGLTTLVGAWNDPSGSIIRLEVFSINGISLGSVEGSQGSFLGITAEGIARARFTHVQTQSVTGYTVDDLYFTAPTAVPAPPAVWLLASGMGALGWRAWRRVTKRAA